MLICRLTLYLKELIICYGFPYLTSHASTINRLYPSFPALTRRRWHRCLVCISVLQAPASTREARRRHREIGLRDWQGWSVVQIPERQELLLYLEEMDVKSLSAFHPIFANSSLRYSTNRPCSRVGSRLCCRFRAMKDLRRRCN